MMREANELPSLPRGWAWATVGDIWAIVGGGTPSTKVAEYWQGSIPWMTSADIYDLKDIRPRKQITPEAIQDSATNLVPAGSIIVVTRVGLGKVALTTIDLCFSQDSQALVGSDKHVDPEYALHFLSQAVQVFRYRHRGTTIAGVPKRQLAELPVALPPLPEQHRIVAKIEELFTRLDAGVEALKRAQALVKRYRQAVLKAAFSGKLTAEWREKHKGELEPASVLLERIRRESVPGAGRGDGTLPDQWALATIGQVASINCPDASVRDLPDSMPVTFVPMAAVDAATGSISDPRVRPLGEVRRGFTQFHHGDVLFAKITPCMENGKAAIARGLKNGLGFGSTEFHVFRPQHGVLSEWLFHFVRTSEFRKAAKASFTGTAGQLRVPAAFVRDSLIPIAPTVEQRQIVTEIERRFSIADQLEATIEAGLKQSERLRQSILKAAFEGRLVPQDPSDEPAEKLLERIRAEREKRERLKPQQRPRKAALRRMARTDQQGGQLSLLGVDGT